MEFVPMSSHRGAARSKTKNRLHVFGVPSTELQSAKSALLDQMNQLVQGRIQNFRTCAARETSKGRKTSQAAAANLYSSDESDSNAETSSSSVEREFEAYWTFKQQKEE
ncbi:hypothetical protein GN244_ATG16359 [Phytophthora infestans]|uniref:Uncharacterized protein n=1 Tax=Phytophthora infestans TaxID=4787 RepID=A0A833SL96_PHYIN|nr:hypothetical protein GN244_ATG16359 [Phytophthora infestans]KAF4146700.1 hypothetical protein GN958_ATG04113 [Phytophthora infestans]